MANEDKATRYHRLQRRASIIATLLVALTMIVLLVSGASASLRAVASDISRSSFLLTTVIYVTVVVLLSELVQLPLSIYQGVVLERRYGLSTQTTRRWWGDHLKGTLVATVLAIGGAWLVWGLLRWNARDWWWAAALALTAVLVVMAQLAPVVLLPIFYQFKPLDRPALVERLRALVDRALGPRKPRGDDGRVLGVFEWRLSDRTRKANAALTGIGRTRRILLSDTLLAEHSDDEIEVILAHELAHHVHRDIWRGIALEAVLIVLGFYLTDRVLSIAGTAFGLTGKADIAALPLLVLTAGGVSLLLVPVMNAFSRAHERRADRYALEMTGNAGAFAVAMKRLAQQNLAEEEPSRLVEVLFHSHPSIRARIAAAEKWKEEKRL